MSEVGMGNANAQRETELAITYFNPDILFFVGIAGGIKDVLIGDVVAATKVYYYELVKVEEENISNRPDLEKSNHYLVMQAKFEAENKQWLKCFADKLGTKPQVFVSPIASGEKIIASTKSDLFKFLRKYYNDAIAVEMEGFGFLSAASLHPNVKAIVIRGISDLLDNKNDDSSESEHLRHERASYHASAFAFEILAQHKANDLQKKESYRGVTSYGINPDELIANIFKQVKIGNNNESSRINDERHKRIEYALELINRGDFSQAVHYLEVLKEEIWYQVDNILKYRITSNLAMAKLGLDEISDAAVSFIEALQYNPEDDKAIAYAAMGYCFQRDYTNAENLVDKALQKNPANVLAYSLCIRISSITESIESILEKIPPPYRESLDVLIALGEAAINRKLYNKAEEWLQKALDIKQDISMISVKAFLGVALIEPIAQNYVLIAAGQILEYQKHSLERAISLFTEVLGGYYVDPKDLSHLKFTALVNRLSALRLLGRYDEAIHDIEIARQKEPNDSYLIKQRALLAHEKGDEKAAHEYATLILSSPKVPEAFLLVANFLMALNRDKEAEEILNQFLRTDNSEELKREASRLKFEIW